MNEIGWLDYKALGCYLHDFASVMIIEVPSWKVNGSMSGRHGDALPNAVYRKVVPRYVEVF